jgi:hypothetical protein
MGRFGCAECPHPPVCHGDEDVVFRVRGKNIDGEQIDVAAAVLNATTIKIITVI